MTKVFYFLVILSFLGFGSCKKKSTSPDYCNTAWTTQIQSQVTAFTNAATVYAADPTPANCTTYKAAYNNYIKALEPFSNCTAWTAQEKSDFDTALAQAKAGVATLCQ